ncbi:MAG: (d)CMP kinase [Desulfovibrionaceae bacterium]|nr:(d)CMP kinase [Desulfovibrionaceae bacterium]
MPSPLIVTLDGPAGVGKSSLARRLAAALGIGYLDTGAMFRAVAWRLGPGSWDWGPQRLENGLKDLRFELRDLDGEQVLFMDSEPLDPDIRTEEVGMWASNLAAIPAVREFLKQAQRDIGQSASLVAEGRDMGSVVFPRARCKFFLEAEAMERARRRWLQLKAMGRDADLEEIADQTRRRDRQDRERAVAPLAPAPDAALIDTTRLSEDQVFERLLGLVRAARP